MTNEDRPSRSIEPFTVTTTIVTTVDPKTFNEDQILSHVVTVDTDGPPEMPEWLTYATAQAACEHTMEHLAEYGIGVMGEVVEEDPEEEDPGYYDRCPIGNLYRYHTKPCEPACDFGGAIIEGAVLYDSEEDAA